MASWAEVMTGTPVSDHTCIRIYREARDQRYGGGDAGLTIPQAFLSLTMAGVLPEGCHLRRVETLDSLCLAPLVAAYASTEGWYYPNADGYIHLDTRRAGWHAVLLVAYGSIPGDRVIWVENSWGRNWGKDGFGCMTEAYHLAHCTELWQVVIPGRPTTATALRRHHDAQLADHIGGYVRSIVGNLALLGYSVPCDPAVVMADIVHRSMAGKLTPAEESARSRLADVYLLLRGQGFTDAQIIQVATS
jgi:hypothetical protein